MNEARDTETINLFKPENERKRYAALDGLRTYATLGIVLMHVWANGNYRIEGSMFGGFIFHELIPSFTNFVFLFMEVSAFGMCCGYYEKMVNSQISLEEFYKKRYAKIWPLFALLCVLDFVISPSLEALYEVFANLTLCFGLLPNAGMEVIGVGWFLGVVFVFYLLFPFFCYLLSDKRRAWFAFAVALVFNYLCSVYFEAGRSNIVYSAVYFIAGGLVFLYRDKLAKVAGKHRLLAFLACAAGAVLYFVIGANTMTMLALSIVVLIYALGIVWGGVLDNSFTRFIGGISFEIYLCHMVIFRVLEKLGLVHLFGSGWASYIVVVAGTVIGAVVFSLCAKWFLKMVGQALERLKTKRDGKGIAGYGR